MKSCLLLLLFTLPLAFGAKAQVKSLPPGKYETVMKNNQVKWDQGDIILIDETHYKISTNNNIGEYRFSVTAQRIFFTSGPLKSVFARISDNNQTPVIVLPSAENEQTGFKLPADVWGYFRQ